MPSLSPITHHKNTNYESNKSNPYLTLQPREPAPLKLWALRESSTARIMRQNPGKIYTTFNQSEDSVQYQPIWRQNPGKIYCTSTQHINQSGDSVQHQPIMRQNPGKIYCTSTQHINQSGDSVQYQHFVH